MYKNKMHKTYVDPRHVSEVAIKFWNSQQRPLKISSILGVVPLDGWAEHGAEEEISLSEILRPVVSKRHVKNTKKWTRCHVLFSLNGKDCYRNWHYLHDKHVLMFRRECERVHKMSSAFCHECIVCRHPTSSCLLWYPGYVMYTFVRVGYLGANSNVREPHRARWNT